MQTCEGEEEEEDGRTRVSGNMQIRGGLVEV